MHRPTRQRLKESGFALITTLWVMAILGVMAASLAFEAQCETRIEAWTMQSRRAYNLARAGVHLTAGLIRNHARDTSHNLYDKWFSGPANYKDAQFGPGYYSILRNALEPGSPGTGRPGLFARDDHDPEYGLVDEESMFNINVIDFYQLCRIPGISEIMAADIILYIDDKKKDLEEKNDNRRKAGLPEIVDEPGLSTLPVQRLDELLAVEGVTRKLLYGTPESPGGLSRYLTCFSSGKVNINTAAPDVLRAIGFNEQHIKVFTEYRRGKWDGFTSVQAALDLVGIDSGYLNHILSVTSKNFRITCQAGFTPDKPEERITARLTLGDEGMRFTLWEATAVAGQNRIGDSPRRVVLN